MTQLNGSSDNRLLCDKPLRGLGIGLNLQGCVADVGSRIAIHATRDAIRVLRRRRLCVDERRQGGDKTPAGLGQRATTQTHSAVFLAVSTCLAEVAAMLSLRSASAYGLCSAVRAVASSFLSSFKSNSLVVALKALASPLSDDQFLQRALRASDRNMLGG